ncbi:hypothetical protein TNCV_5039441 [Trichonephila clavipes]|nr:hypothetical protein TNCV_5039441 [Trichonephila clavipes]
MSIELKANSGEIPVCKLKTSTECFLPEWIYFSEQLHLKYNVQGKKRYDDKQLYENQHLTLRKIIRLPKLSSVSLFRHLLHLTYALEHVTSWNSGIPGDSD